MRQCRHVFIALIAFFICVPVVQAQMLDIQKIQKIPRFKELTDEKFTAETNAVEEKPKGDKYLAYRLRLPKDWSKVLEDAPPEEEGSGQEMSRRILGKVNTYFSPANTDILSRFEVRALELEHDISARNWFLNYVLVNGYTLQGMEEVSNRRVEALYVLLEKDIPYIVRTVAEINGSRIVLASYYMPDMRWEAEKAIQEKIVGSFKFIKPERIRIESARTFAFLDILRFDYPVSWRLSAPNIYSTDVMDAKLVSSPDDKILDGEISVHIISTELDTTLAQEVQNLKGDITDTGLAIGKLIEVPTNYKFHNHIYFSRVEVYQANDKLKKVEEHEYWLAIMAEDRYYYIVTMVTPSRGSNFYIWVRNSGAFQTVIESLRP